MPDSTAARAATAGAAADARLAHRRAVATLVFCAFCWSIAGVFTRRLDSAAGLELTFWRSLWCAAAMIALLAWRVRGSPWPIVRAMGAAGMVSGAMWAVMFTCFMVALTRTSVANTLAVMSIAPLLAALFARVVLGEPVRLGTWLAIVAAGAGIVLMTRDGLSGSGIDGMLIAAAVPLASAVNLVVLRRMRARVDLVPAVLVGAAISAVLTLPFAVPFEASGRDVVVLAFLGIVQLAIPCMLMVRAARHLSPHEVALIALLEVILGPLWAWLGAGEAMAAATIQGGLLVLAALVANELLGAWRPRRAGVPR